MIKIDLKTLMQEQNLSIQDVYEGTGISRNTISQLYNGKSKGIQFETLSKLSDFLGVDPAYMFYDVAKYEKLALIANLVDTVEQPQSISDIKEKYTVDDSTEVKSPSLFAYIYFFNSKQIQRKEHLDKTVASFRLPIYISYSNENDCLSFSNDVDLFMQDHDEPELHVTQNRLDEFTSLNKPEKVENAFASAISFFLKKLKLTDLPLFINFSINIGNRSSSNVNYMWWSKIMTDKKVYSKYIYGKYPYLKYQSKRFRTY